MTKIKNKRRCDKDLVIVMGPPAVGKSEFCRIATEEFGTQSFGTDRERELRSIRPEDKEKTNDAYCWTIDRALAYLQSGGNLAFIDATFYRQEWRDLLIERTQASNVGADIIIIDALQDTIEKRVVVRQNRVKQGASVYLGISDPDVAARIRNSMILPTSEELQKFTGYAKLLNSNSGYEIQETTLPKNVDDVVRGVIKYNGSR